ncbi:tetratricopeptide repeat protein [Sandaracinus amylolyticus]|uniref:tetratricopeptide repeat protein n=1 Tax=Sandaracinus amylolyticus TaxID=927083 RepID=UPI00069FE1F7|nr:tetratricopeptide repeat protein [Sandaracinus amylolyticus]
MGCGDSAQPPGHEQPPTGGQRDLDERPSAVAEPAPGRLPATTDVQPPTALQVPGDEGAPTPAHQVSASDGLRRCETLLRQNRRVAAYECFQNASYPPAGEFDDGRAACGAGWGLFRLGYLTEADMHLRGGLAAATRAREIRGEETFDVVRAACLYNLGRVSEARGDRERAEVYYRQSIQLRPNDAVQARLVALPDSGRAGEFLETCASTAGVGAPIGGEDELCRRRLLRTIGGWYSDGLSYCAFDQDDDTNATRLNEEYEADVLSMHSTYRQYDEDVLVIRGRDSVYDLASLAIASPNSMEFGVRGRARSLAVRTSAQRIPEIVATAEHLDYDDTPIEDPIRLADCGGAEPCSTLAPPGYRPHHFERRRTSHVVCRPVDEELWWCGTFIQDTPPTAGAIDERYRSRGCAAEP